MNATIAQFARKQIKAGLVLLPEGWQNKFKLMYGKIDMTVDDVVNKMPDTKLDWALSQVENSLRKATAK